MVPTIGPRQGRESKQVTLCKPGQGTLGTQCLSRPTNVSLRTGGKKGRRANPEEGAADAASPLLKVMPGLPPVVQGGPVTPGRRLRLMATGAVTRQVVTTGEIGQIKITDQRVKPMAGRRRRDLAQIKIGDRGVTPTVVRWRRSHRVSIDPRSGLIPKVKELRVTPTLGDQVRELRRLEDQREDLLLVVKGQRVTPMSGDRVAGSQRIPPLALGVLGDQAVRTRPLPLVLKPPGHVLNVTG